MTTFAMHDYYRQSAALTVDTNAHNYFDDDDDGILDDGILDHSAIDSGLEMSPPMEHSRRDSQPFAVSANIFSPKPDEWQQVEMQPMPANNPFVEQQHSNNPFMRIDSQQAAAYAHPAHGWINNHGAHSGMSTPMAGHDGLPTDFDVPAPIFQRPMQGGQTPFSNPNQLAAFPASNSSSPQKEWAVTDGMDHRQTKRMRVSSPMLRSQHEIPRRGDGIRKKNARFDIPAERNLANIDQLILASSDNADLNKELKQQKRLLRNRQAALDSRQRKKQHTERLEDEKKFYTQQINELEEDLAEAKLQLDDWAREKHEYEQYIQTMQMEKEEMVRNHTLETGDLRKKVSVLTEHMQKMDMGGTAMSTVPSSTGFTADYSDIDSLAMDGAWDNISFLNDYDMERGAGDVNCKVENQNQNPNPNPNQLVPTKKADSLLSISDHEKPAAQGLLLMLLLVGAFVASKGSSPNIPRMSDDVRAASASLLEDVFKDAGLQPSAASISEAMAPLPSGSHNQNAWSTNAHALGNNMAPSALGDLAVRLVRPSEDQNNEQLFSLSAAQYNSLTSQDFLQNPPAPSTSQGRRNLGETLAAMRSNSKTSAAEVYTRSLLYNEIPSDVVKTFHRMVSDMSRNGQEEPAS